MLRDALLEEVAAADVGGLWRRIGKFDATAAALADEHYSRRKRGSPGLAAMNGLDGWTCTIFRNTGRQRSSDLILQAELMLASLAADCGPDGMLTYVFDKKVRSPNPGYCFKTAGWRVLGRSADGKKTLPQKAFGDAGVALPASAETATRGKPG